MNEYQLLPNEILNKIFLSVDFIPGILFLNKLWNYEYKNQNKENIKIAYYGSKKYLAKFLQKYTLPGYNITDEMIEIFNKNCKNHELDKIEIIRFKRGENAYKKINKSFKYLKFHYLENLKSIAFWMINIKINYIPYEFINLCALRELRINLNGNYIEIPDLSNLYKLQIFSIDIIDNTQPIIFSEQSKINIYKIKNLPFLTDFTIDSVNSIVYYLNVFDKTTRHKYNRCHMMDELHNLFGYIEKFIPNGSNSSIYYLPDNNIDKTPIEYLNEIKINKKEMSYKDIDIDKWPHKDIDKWSDFDFMLKKIIRGN